MAYSKFRYTGVQGKIVSKIKITISASYCHWSLWCSPEMLFSHLFLKYPFSWKSQFFLQFFIFHSHKLLIFYFPSLSLTWTAAKQLKSFLCLFSYHVRILRFEFHHQWVTISSKIKSLIFYKIPTSWHGRNFKRKCFNKTKIILPPCRLTWEFYVEMVFTFTSLSPKSKNAFTVSVWKESYLLLFTIFGVLVPPELLLVIKFLAASHTYN